MNLGSNNPAYNPNASPRNQSPKAFGKKLPKSKHPISFGRIVVAFLYQMTSDMGPNPISGKMTEVLRFKFNIDLAVKRIIAQLGDNYSNIESFKSVQVKLDIQTFIAA